MKCFQHSLVDFLWRWDLVAVDLVDLAVEEILSHFSVTPNK